MDRTTMESSPETTLFLDCRDASRWSFALAANSGRVGRGERQVSKHNNSNHILLLDSLSSIYKALFTPDVSVFSTHSVSLPGWTSSLTNRLPFINHDFDIERPDGNKSLMEFISETEVHPTACYQEVTSHFCFINKFCCLCLMFVLLPHT